MLHCMLVTQQPVDTALVYSRDSTAGPLVHLQRTLDDLASEVFKPDCTGLVIEVTLLIRLWQTLLRVVTSLESLASAMAEEHTSDDPDLESESSSEDSRDEEFGGDDLQLAAGAENEIGPLWNQLGMMSGSMSFTQNCRLSTMYHLVADGAGSHLKCGRVIATNFDAVDDEPKFVYPMCATCFGRRT